MRKGFVFGTVAVALVMIGVAVNCAPSDDETVVIVSACDVGQLANNPGEQTVRAYVETAQQLKTRAAEIEKRFTELCNSINTESGGQPGADIRASCGLLATRLAKAQAQAVIPDGGAVLPQWIYVGYPEACASNTAEQAACLSQCGTAPCDPGKCATEKQSGTCSGDCTGTCVTDGVDAPCQGACRGINAPLDGGAPPSCAGECIGQCAAPTWTGICEQGCDKDFRGSCQGTCTGTCDDVAVGDAGTPPTPDSGTPDAGDPDAGEAGPIEAGPPPDAGPPGPAPGGADGNCKGVCVGTCSSKASGSCAAVCRGSGFSGGSCSRCAAPCTTAGEGCLTTCNGECLTRAENSKCAGTCVGTCSAPMTNVTCAPGDLACEANDQCKNVCAVKAATGAKCDPPTAAVVRVAGDYGIYAALKKYAPQLAAVSVEAAMLNEQSLKIANVRLQDYAAIGATRDRARICITETGKVVTESRASLARSVGAADAIRNGKAF